MPELAEVEYYRKQWEPGRGLVVKNLLVRGGTRMFRDNARPSEMEAAIAGSVLRKSQAHGKHMLFSFSRVNQTVAHLGIHLGMTGKLFHRQEGTAPEKHDHLVLRMSGGLELVFQDPRRFGAIRFSAETDLPDWWTALPPAILSRAFTRELLGASLDRHAKAPLKGVLLMQEHFPGIGNWMADEILWQARLSPRRPAGSLDGMEQGTLYRLTRRVCRMAMKTIGRDFSDPPPSWLFRYRWEKGHLCPRCRTPLQREQTAGRTTCRCPVCQDG